MSTINIHEGVYWGMYMCLVAWLVSVCLGWLFVGMYMSVNWLENWWWMGCWCVGDCGKGEEFIISIIL